MLKFHLCVRRSGVLGVEMKTLPVNTNLNTSPLFHSEKRHCLPERQTACCGEGEVFTRQPCDHEFAWYSTVGLYTCKKTPGVAGTHGRTRAHGRHRRTSQPSKPPPTHPHGYVGWTVTRFLDLLCYHVRNSYCRPSESSVPPQQCQQCPPLPRRQKVNRSRTTSHSSLHPRSAGAAQAHNCQLSCYSSASASSA